jgi:hypothetical protein
VWCGLFGGHSLAEPFKRLLPGLQSVLSAWQATLRQYRQSAAANFADATTNPNPITGPVMCLSSSSAVTDERRLPAHRTLARQSLALGLVGLALFAATWDKDDHGCEGMPRNRHPPRHMTRWPRLRS